MTISDKPLKRLVKNFERKRPKNASTVRFSSCLVQPLKLPFETINQNIEWISHNWRKRRLHTLSESPILTLLELISLDLHYLPSAKEIMEGLI